MPVAFGSSSGHFGLAVVNLVCLTVCLLVVEACGVSSQQPAVENTQHYSASDIIAAELSGCGGSTSVLLAPRRRYGESTSHLDHTSGSDLKRDVSALHSAPRILDVTKEGNRLSVIGEAAPPIELQSHPYYVWPRSLFSAMPEDSESDYGLPVLSRFFLRFYHDEALPWWRPLLSHLL